VSLNELVNERLVLLDLPLSNEYFLSLFAAAGLRPKISERTSSLPIARSMVGSNFGYGLLNVPSKNIHPPNGKPLSYIPLEKTHRPMALGMATMRSERKSKIVDPFEAQRRKSITGHSAPGMSLLY